MRGRPWSRRACLRGAAALALAGPAGALPGRSSDPFQERLREPVSAWYRAREGRDREAAARALEAVEEAVAALRRVTGAEPLADLEAWGRLLEEVRAPDLPAAAAPERRRFEEAGWLELPARGPAEERLPLSLLLGPGEGLPGAGPRRQAVWRPDLEPLLGRGPEDEDFRFLLLPALGRLLRRLAVDRDRVHLVALGPEAAALAAVLAEALPSFFASLVRVGAPAAAGGEGLRQGAVPVLDLPAGADWEAVAARQREVEPRRLPRAFGSRLALPWAGRVHWVQAVLFEPSGLAETTGPPPTWLQARVEPEAGRIHLQARRVSRVHLFLQDGLLDLDRDFTLVRNGLSCRFRAERSAAVLLENFALDLDSRLLYPAILRDLDLPAGEEGAG